MADFRGRSYRFWHGTSKNGQIAMFLGAFQFQKAKSSIIGQHSFSVRANRTVLGTDMLHFRMEAYRYKEEHIKEEGYVLHSLTIVHAEHILPRVR